MKPESQQELDANFLIAKRFLKLFFNEGLFAAPTVQ
jgi:hypothetical protein